MLNMKTYQVLFWVFIAFFIASSASAQDQKIGYVDTDYILSQMSEYKGVKQQLSSISSEWNAQLEEMKAKIDNLKQDFQAREILYTDEQRAQKQQ